MLEGIPSDLYLAMQTEPLVYNSHNFCIKPDWFTGNRGSQESKDRKCFENLAKPQT